MQKFKLLTQLFTASIVAVAAIASSQTPAKAQATSFSCGTSEGKLATVARTPRGASVPVIYWDSDYFSDSGYTPQARCQMVSQRFETFRQAGTLDYLTTGRMNNMPVICVASGVGRACAENGLLFTLKSNSDPNQILEDLMAVRNRASGVRLYETSIDGEPIVQRDAQTDNLYVDVEGFLNIVSEETAPSTDNDSVF